MASLLGGGKASPLAVKSSPLAAKSPCSVPPQYQNEWSFCKFLETSDSGPSQKCLRLLERSVDNGQANYAALDEDASNVSRFLYGSTASLQFPFGQDSVSLCTISGPTQVSQLLREFLLERDGWRVEIWAWDQIRKAFRCVKRGSPGNIEAVEDLMWSDQELNAGSSPAAAGGLSAASQQSVSPVIAAVLVTTESDGSLQVSLGWCDTTAFRIGYLSFLDNSLLTTLETALIQLGVREMLTPTVSGSTSNDTSSKLLQIAEASNIAVQPLKASEYFGAAEGGGVEGDLCRLVGEDRVKMPELSVSVAKCLRCCMTYLGLLATDANIGAFKAVSHNLADFVRLDEAALTSLNIFPKQASSSSQTTSRSFSLFGFLDHCKTAAGSRTLNQWLRQPLQNRDVIENRLDLAQLWVECPQARQKLRELVFRGIPDIAKLVKRVLRARSSLQEVVQLYQAVAKLHQILMEIDASEDVKEHGKYDVLNVALLEPMRQLATQFGPFVQMIEDTLDFEALARNEYCVRYDFDPELQEIWADKQRVLDAMGPEFDRVCRELRLEAGKKCKLEVSGMYGHVFRVSRLDAGKLGSLNRKRPASGTLPSTDDSFLGDADERASGADAQYTELSTLKSGVLFVTPTLRDLSRRYGALNELYCEKQGSLVLTLITSTQSFRTAFDVLGSLLAMLDVVLAGAHVAGSSSHPYVRPEFGNEQVFELIEARHPCVEVQPGITFIPNTVSFDRTEAAPLLQVITGPNMGGKSTFIRQTALIAIMAQCGFYVPCQRAQLPLFDAILVRVGAGDCLMRGISTFMAEMLETAAILQTATQRSLVVIDELGRGTSTCDGIALSRAIALHLAEEVKCLTYFATHFHELSELESSSRLVGNLHVSAAIDPVSEELSLLYRVRPGPCDRSFGVHVARVVGFPRAVVAMAQWRADVLEGRRPGVLSSAETEWLATGADASSVPADLAKYFAQ